MGTKNGNSVLYVEDSCIWPSNSHVLSRWLFAAALDDSYLRRLFTMAIYDGYLRPLLMTATYDSYFRRLFTTASNKPVCMHSLRNCQQL